MMQVISDHCCWRVWLNRDEALLIKGLSKAVPASSIAAVNEYEAQLLMEIFDPATSIPFMARHGVTHAGAGPVFHHAYLETQRASGPEPIFPDIRLFYGGGAPKPPLLHEQLQREIGGSGVYSVYGMTECPIITMGRPRDPW